jgi:hypothetical protein
MRQFIALLGALFTVVTLSAAPVFAAQPHMEWVPVDDVFVDTFLTDACGVEVTVHETGHFISRAFTDADGDLVRAVNNFALSVTWSSEKGTVQAKDVGADLITFLDDGSIIRLVIGSVQSISIPGQGRVYQEVGRTLVVITFDANGDPTFDVTPLGGQHDSNQLDVICGVLGG